MIAWTLVKAKQLLVHRVLRTDVNNNFSREEMQGGYHGKIYSMTTVLIGFQPKNKHNLADSRKITAEEHPEIEHLVKYSIRKKIPENDLPEGTSFKPEKYYFILTVRSN